MTIQRSRNHNINSHDIARRSKSRNRQKVKKSARSFARRFWKSVGFSREFNKGRVTERPIISISLCFLSFLFFIYFALYFALFDSVIRVLHSMMSIFSFVCLMNHPVIKFICLYLNT